MIPDIQSASWADAKVAELVASGVAEVVAKDAVVRMQHFTFIESPHLEHTRALGGRGSGNFGHKGRKGEVGGSGEGGGTGVLEREEVFISSPHDAFSSIAAGEKATVVASDLRSVLKEAATSRITPVDLTNLTVEGTPIFAGGLGRNRLSMPQISKEEQPAFLASLKDQHIDVKRESVSPISLKPTQNEIDAGRVGQKLQKYDAGKTIRPVMVSKDNYVLDGHHRWAVETALAFENPKANLKIPVIRLMAEHEKALAVMLAYTRKHGIKAEALQAQPGETAVHAAADLYRGNLQTVIHRAFQAARSAYKEGGTDAAISALRSFLTMYLPHVLQRTIQAGGDAAVEMLVQHRAAGDVEGHEFHGNQWTSGSIAENYTAGQYVRVRVKKEDEHGPIAGGGKTHDLKVTAVSNQFLTGIAVNKSGDEITGKKFDEQKHVIQHSVIEKHQHLELDKTYAVLKPRGGKVRGLAGPITMQFNASNPTSAQWIKEHGLTALIDGISETTRTRIQEVIAEQQTTGEESESDILDAIGDEDRAELIALTESMAAANEGNREAWDQAVEEGLLPEDAKKVWIAAEDACDDCAELDGEEVGLDEDYPGDGGDGPPLHPRCRCSEGIAS